MYSKLALCGTKNKCARTDTVFFPISQVSTRGVTLDIYVSDTKATTNRLKKLSRPKGTFAIYLVVLSQTLTIHVPTICTLLDHQLFISVVSLTTSLNTSPPQHTLPRKEMCNVCCWTMIRLQFAVRPGFT